MVKGLVLSLASAACLGGGCGMFYLARHKVLRLRQEGSSPDAERFWSIMKFFGIVLCAIAGALLIIALNHPNPAP